MKAMSEKFSALAEALADFCNSVESAVVSLRRQVSELAKAETRTETSIPEERFSVLRWEDEKGSRLGDYQAAYQKNNLPEAWSHALNVLRANNSLIADPFKEEGTSFDIGFTLRSIRIAFSVRN